MNAMELEQQSVKQWEAVKKWRDLYISGLRISFNGQVFQFWENSWPSRLRVETLGYNAFNCKLIQPTGEHAALVAEYGDRWLKFFPAQVPAKLQDKFFHLLSKDYEFYNLSAECEKLGLNCYGLPLDGGIFPQIVDRKEKSKGNPGDDKQPVKPGILQEYLAGFGEIDVDRRLGYGN